MTVRWPRPTVLGDPGAPHLVVEASAGTGKTFFLEHRVVDLLLAPGTEPATIDRIVVVTYTEKATAELRARIRRLLTAMVWDAPPPAPAEHGPDDVWILDETARTRLRTALDLVDTAPISTIHGFCQRILADESFAAGRAFDQENVPDEVALRDAFIDALRERFAVAPEERALLHAYLDAGCKLDDLFRDVLALYRFGLPLSDDGGAPHQRLKALVLDEVVARADRSKRRGGQVDFHDMLRLTARALDADAGLARRIALRFPWALIDEFQDTDPIQWQIAARIWREPPARGLTIVGDPKQAIYSFRGGDVATYLAATRELAAAGAARATLGVNQRSTAPLVAAVNRLLRKPRSLFHGSGIDEAQPVRASGKVEARWADGRPLAPIALLAVAPALVSDGADATRAAIVEATADEIARLVGDPRHRIVGTARGRDHEVGPGDIFVLTRTNAESIAAAAAIRRRGVPCAFHQAEHLFGTREAADVADLLAAIARPRDRTAQVRAWMTCFFDVDPEALARAREVPDDHPLAARFHDWRGAASRLDYPRLFRSILDDTRVVERALALGGGTRTVTNLGHVLEYLYGEIERSRCELPELVSRLRAQIADAETLRPDDSDVQRRETDQPAVQVMTVHRAKGLEAWVVFVTGGVAFAKRPDDSVMVGHEDGRRVAVLKGSQRVAQTQQHEDQRLAYVALTRARARLYLPVLPAKTSKAAAKKPRSSTVAEHGWHGIYGALHDALEDLHATFGGSARGSSAAAVAAIEAATSPPSALPENVIRFPGEAPIAIDPWPAAAGTEGILDASVVPLPPPPPAVAEPERLGPRAGFIVTSYSRLKRDASELDVAQVTAEDRSRRSPAPDELPGGAATGQLLHMVLERADFAIAAATELDAWQRRPEIVALFDEAERRFGVDRRFRPQAAALVHRTIATPLEPPVVLGTLALPSLARAPRLAREVEFVYPIPEPPLASLGGRGFVKGFIDAIVAWDDRWFVIDYKSDVLDDDAAVIERHVDEHYALQAELYALAARHMLGLRDGGDLAARFGGLLYWFLRPNRIVHRAPSWADLGRYAGALAEREYA